MSEKRKYAKATLEQKIALCVLVAFIIICIYTKLWYGVIFFCFCLSCYFLKYIFPNSRIHNPLSDEENLRLYKEDFGIFTYTETGFDLENDKHVNWNDIRKVTIYKEDLIAIDCIYVSIELETDEVFRINEETPGYYQFMLKLEEKIQISPTWFPDVAFPAFERNETVIYEKSKISFSQ